MHRTTIPARANWTRFKQAALAALEIVQDESNWLPGAPPASGRSSPVMLVFARMGQIPKEVRQQVGQKANQVKLT
jgi:hypothetical protein